MLRVGGAIDTLLEAFFPPWSDWPLEQAVDKVSTSNWAEELDSAGAERSSEPEETEVVGNSAGSSLDGAEFEGLVSSERPTS